MTKDYIYIALATDKNYAQHAAVTITSVLRNTNNPQKIYFFVIDDNIGEANKNKLQKTVAGFGSQINFVKANEEVLANVFVSGNITRTSYFRLDIPNIIPNNVEKIIYLDCDLLVLDDIKELWNFDMRNRPVAAAEDYGILSSKNKCAEKIKNIGWKKEGSYFNDGVLVLNLKKWRQENYVQKLISLITTRNFRHHDQDALNYLFMDNWTMVPLKWNVIPPVFNMKLRIFLNKKLRQNAVRALKNEAILHYAGGYKPWEYDLYKGFNEKYYEYLALTEYKDVIMPQPNPRKKCHSINRQLLRLRWAKFVTKIFGN